MIGSESEFDPETGTSILINDTAIPDDQIMTALEQQMPELSVLNKWSTNLRRSRNAGLFSRDRYVTPDNIFDQFKVATDAASSDDVVAGVVETTEQLAFRRLAIECDDDDESDVWNQIIDDLNLVTRMREIWRELFVISQCYPSIMWTRKTYKVTGKGRKKTFANLQVPIGITLLDPMKVLPVGNFMFNQEQLVYIVSDLEEANEIEKTLAGDNTSDLIVKSLLKDRYNPSASERREIQEITGQNSSTSYFSLNADQVWRITSTRPHYQRFADVRLKSVFELLDLKHLLREMDRAHILGAANMIILVKKGTDQRPAVASELSALASQVKNAARIPIIVGDHRIEVEIITPKLDKTLSPERYNALDSRITARMFQVLNTGSYNSGTGMDDSMKLLKVIAASMEARRDNIRDSINEHVIKEIYRRNDSLITKPKLQFYPRRIALDFDPNIATFLQDLRDRGDLSRETILAELDIIESEEAKKREKEASDFDHIFAPTNVPFSSTVSPNTDTKNGSSGNGETTTDPVSGTGGSGNTRSAGRSGGRAGGGTNRNSVRSGPPRGPAK